MEGGIKVNIKKLGVRKWIGFGWLKIQSLEHDN